VVPALNADLILERVRDAVAAAPHFPARAFSAEAEREVYERALGGHGTA
jgi:hypothetical protein